MHTGTNQRGLLSGAVDLVILPMSGEGIADPTAWWVGRHDRERTAGEQARGSKGGGGRPSDRPRYRVQIEITAHGGTPLRMNCPGISEKPL